MLNEVFGVKGQFGDMKFEPGLLPSQFDEKGEAGVAFEFNGKPVDVIYDTGIFSEDLKTLHFDSFRSRPSKFGSYFVFKDLDFARK